MYVPKSVTGICSSRREEFESEFPGDIECDTILPELPVPVTCERNIFFKGQLFCDRLNPPVVFTDFAVIARPNNFFFGKQDFDPSHGVLPLDMVLQRDFA